MAKYVQSGIVDHVNNHADQYGEITSSDFQESMNIITTANSMFEELPAKTRQFFENNPAKFMDYVQDPQNADKLYGLGLTNEPINEPNTEPKEPPKTPQEPPPKIEE